MSTYPPFPQQQPPKKKTGRTIGLGCLGAFAVTVFILVLVGIVTSGGDSDDTSDTGQGSTTVDTREDKPKDDKKEPPSEKADEADEADDLISIELDDRSEYGIADIWVTYTIKNTSSKPSDYMISYEVVDSSGTRMYNSELYVTEVQPGQTSKDEDITTLDTVKGMEINVTKLDRTESW